MGGVDLAAGVVRVVRWPFKALASLFGAEVPSMVILLRNFLYGMQDNEDIDL